MKKFKKILALGLSLAMALGMGVTSFAAEVENPSTAISGLPSANDKTTAIVQNVEPGSTVTAYRVVEPVYDKDLGFTGYRVASEGEGDAATPIVDIADPLKPAASEILDIAKDSDALAKLETVGPFQQGTLKPDTGKDPTTDGKADYTAQLGAGYWLILITGATEDVYNPMLLGVYYTNVDGTGNSLEGDILDTNSKWGLESAPVFAKSTKPTIEKTIVNGDGTTASGDAVDHGNDVGINGTVSFQIDTVIPSYSKEYTNVEVKVTDTLSKGLTLKEGTIKVYVDNVEITEDNIANVYTQTITKNEDSTTLDIAFLSSYVLADAADGNGAVKTVKITYNATLNEDATVNFDPNTNNAKLIYTNNPDVNADEKTGEVDDKTYTYTFGLGTWIAAEGVEGSEVTEEIVKIDEKGNRIVLDSTTIKDTDKVTKVQVGATFELRDTEGVKVAEATTDKDGKLTFKGLDAGTYTLVETKAPTGFQIDNTEHEVIIEAEYNEDGTLSKYTVTIDNEVTNKYTATYVKGEITKVESSVTTVEIKNTELHSLPSTGGIGTTIFTIGGCAIMILAAALYFATRRKSAR